jgi:heterodisulfide reductase subunit B
LSAFSYYPGCSQTSSAREYGESTLRAARELGIELVELEDWNCCGASSAHMTNHLLSVLLPARNLAIAREQGRNLVIACAACYNRLKLVQGEILREESLARKVEGILGADPRFEGEVLPLLEAIDREVDLAAFKERVGNSLEELRPVSYYGCLLARPRGVMVDDDYEHPEGMDRLLSALGASVLPWSYKTDCCGGSLSLTRSDVVERLVNRLFEAAKEAGANCIVTACPMCMANLEMRQYRGVLRFRIIHNLPIFYFTELICLALGCGDTEEWFRRHLIDPRPLLRVSGLL